MNESLRKEIDPSVVMADIHSLLGRLQAEGAIDEEVPFIQNILQKVESKTISPADAWHQVNKKLAARGDYH